MAQTAALNCACCQDMASDNIYSSADLDRPNTQQVYDTPYRTAISYMQNVSRTQVNSPYLKRNAVEVFGSLTSALLMLLVDFLQSDLIQDK